jgi:hypothetical protein
VQPGPIPTLAAESESRIEEKVDPAVRNALVSTREDAQKLMKWKIPTLARVVNGWSMNTDTMSVYGNYYLKRANRRTSGSRCEPARGRHLSAQSRRRERQAPLDGVNKYALHFDEEAMPAVDAFWSVISRTTPQARRRRTTGFPRPRGRST